MWLVLNAEQDGGIYFYCYNMIANNSSAEVVFVHLLSVT